MGKGDTMRMRPEQDKHLSAKKAAFSSFAPGLGLPGPRDNRRLGP